MALRPQKTLGDARTAILKRLGFRMTPSAATTQNATVDEYIRSAVHELAMEIDWLELRRVVEIPLIEDQPIYSWPDEAGVGQILGVWTKDSRGRVFSISQGTLPSDAPWGDDAPSARPLVLEFVDREIHISPAPSSDWPTLILRVELELPPLIEDNELLPFDSELIIRGALISAAQYYGKPGLDEYRDSYRRYKNVTKGKQQKRRVVSMLGPSSSASRIPPTGDGAPYSEHWKPWDSHV